MNGDTFEIVFRGGPFDDGKPRHVPTCLAAGIREEFREGLSNGIGENRSYRLESRPGWDLAGRGGIFLPAVYRWIPDAPSVLSPRAGRAR